MKQVLRTTQQMILSVDEIHCLNLWKSMNTLTLELNVCVVIYVHVNVTVALVLLSFPHLFHWINSCGQYEKTNLTVYMN